ncbi:DUF4055 domain-containing protein [Dyadobacter bucti]|uniref:DUF4055 domain-containing protein n=1 Tax=Dyadobacter bucti TaxID=2572203 RepID=UPI001107B485|nr:DUF4055 domain-containing protein [Dyadobacter bucti]
MQPDDKHEEYTEFEPVWKRCRDAVAGQRAIQEAGKAYLPMLDGQETTAYDKYRSRALFYNATGRTVDAMTGLVFRKPMVIEVPEQMKPWLEDITLADETLTDFAETALYDVLTVGRGGIMVDMPKAADNITLAQADALQIRPYLTFYKAESILNWELARVNNAYRIVNVWLSENYKSDEGKQEHQIRQLTLTEGAYNQVVWRKKSVEKKAKAANKDAFEWFEYERIIPTKASAAITEIPFYPVSPRKPTMTVIAPPIESLVDVNISHYQNSADLENGAHVSGLPTPYITGVDKEDVGELALGSGTAWLLPNAESKVGFAHVGADGFKSLENLLDRKEKQMASLGARMLAPEKKDAEAAQTHEIKRSGESSVLSATCGVIERQITKALKFAAEWQSIPGDISVELNRDFFPPNFTGADLTAWVSARQAGEISKETLFNVLKYSEWIADERTFEEEQDAIEGDGPTLSEIAEK